MHLKHAIEYCFCIITPKLKSEAGTSITHKSEAKDIAASRESSPSNPLESLTDVGLGRRSKYVVLFHVVVVMHLKLFLGA